MSAPPLYLGLDTATAYLSLALWSPAGGTLAEHRERVGREHGKRLLGAIDALLSEVGADRRDLSGVGLGLGPGSYTGLRVGHAAAQGLVRGLGLAFGGRSSLGAVAAGDLEVGETGVVAFDARRGNVYGAVFKKEAEDVSVLAAPERVARDELLKLYPDLRYLEDGVPDASFLARSVYAGAAARPDLIYL